MNAHAHSQPPLTSPTNRWFPPHVIFPNRTSPPVHCGTARVRGGGCDTAGASIFRRHNPRQSYSLLVPPNPGLPRQQRELLLSIADCTIPSATHNPLTIPIFPLHQPQNRFTPRTANPATKPDPARRYPRHVHRYVRPFPEGGVFRGPTCRPPTFTVAFFRRRKRRVNAPSRVAYVLMTYTVHVHCTDDVYGACALKPCVLTPIPHKYTHTTLQSITQACPPLCAPAASWTW